MTTIHNALRNQPMQIKRTQVNMRALTKI